jgi:GxxExxY protein
MNGSVGSGFQECIDKSCRKTVMLTLLTTARYCIVKHDLIEEELTRSVIGAFFHVYNALGFGFFESVYAAALEHELRKRGHHVAREVSVQIRYKGIILGIQRLDMVVDDKLIVETKSTQELQNAAARQVYSYLRASNLMVGLLLHFGPEPGFIAL